MPRARAGARSMLADRPSGSKLAAFTADRMVADIAAAGWPEGQILGSEADLLDRYGVSRAVLREAVRLLEHLQVARMRQGPGGGLLVLPQSFDSVTDAVSVYLFYIGAELDEVVGARHLLEELAVDLAAGRLDEQHIAEMRSIVEREKHGPSRDPRALHKVIAKATGNPALSFFVDLLNRATLLYLPKSATMSKEMSTYSGDAHKKIVHSILSGDAASAKALMRKHLDDEADYLRTLGKPDGRLRHLPDVAARSEKRGEQTARRIFREVAGQGWRVGDVLGSEAELMKRYEVSRAVLREAVRVLEHLQVARMRQGPGGGLVVVAPGTEAVTDAIALQVDRLGIERQHLFEVRAAVELASLDRALDRINDDDIAKLHKVVAAEHDVSLSEFAVIGHDIHTVLSAVGGNRVIELLVLVLVRLSRFRMSAPKDATRVPVEEVTRVHEGIVAAIATRDAEIARNRMRRHLESLMLWSR